jgi:hypothetical protein
VFSTRAGGSLYSATAAGAAALAVPTRALAARQALHRHFRLTTSPSTASSGRQGAPQAPSEASLPLTGGSAVRPCSSRSAFERNRQGMTLSGAGGIRGSAHCRSMMTRPTKELYREPGARDSLPRIRARAGAKPCPAVPRAPHLVRMRFRVGGIEGSRTGDSAREVGLSGGTASEPVAPPSTSSTSSARPPLFSHQISLPPEAPASDVHTVSSSESVLREPLRNHTPGPADVLPPTGPHSDATAKSCQSGYNRTAKGPIDHA